MEAAAPPAVGPATARVTPSSTVKLPGFWPHSPEMWFHQADCIFATKGMTDSFDKYCHTVAALQHESLCLISDIMRALPEDPYAAVRARLNTSHRMTDYQRAEKLFAMPPLGDRRPSQMMAAMLEMCPPGDEKSKLFPALFLQRLPAQLRVLLAKDDLSNLRSLAEHADELWAHHQQEAAVVAAVEPDGPGEDLVAAVGSRGGPQQGSQVGRGANQRAPFAGGKKNKSKEPEVSRQARMAAGLCLAHWRYGKAAHACVQPCSWTGN